mgnify:FL=1
MNRTTIILIVGGLLVAGVVWYSFLRERQPEALLQSEDLTTGNAIDSDVVAVLLQLRAVSLSGTIFTDPVFRSLQDFGSPVVPEPVGRPNPFAPIGSEGATTTKTLP